MKALNHFSLLLCFVFGSLFQAPQTAQTPDVAARVAALDGRPEDYLLTLQDLPAAFLEKHASDGLVFAYPMQMKLPNYYRAENELRISRSTKGYGIKISISVGNPGYWQDMALGAYPEKDGAMVNQLGGKWDNGVEMRVSSWSLVRFIKGNVLAEVSYRGTDDDLKSIAAALADKLPDEMPSPDTWQLELPPADPNVSLPNKYLLDFRIVHSERMDILSAWDPDERIWLMTRYPFSEFTEAIYDRRLQTYVMKTEVSPTLRENPRFSTYGILGIDGDPLLRPLFHSGEYEAHFWVGDVMILNYTFNL